MIFKNKSFFFSKNLLLKLKKLNNFFGFLFSFQLIIIILLIFFYNFSQIKAKLPPERILNFLTKTIKSLTGFDFKNIDDYFIVTVKGLYINTFGNNLEDLSISIRQENLITLEMQRKFRQEVMQSKNPEKEKIVKKMVRANLSIDDKRYKIKMRVKGDRTIHYNDPKRTSYKIDLIGEDRIFGLEEFSIQKPIIRNYVYEFIFHQLMKESENISLIYKPVNLDINGDKRGVYIVEEGFTKYLLERNKRRNGPIFNTVDLASGYYPNVTYEAFSEYAWLSENQNLLKAGYSILNNLKDNPEFNSDEFLNWKSWARFFAVVDLVEGYHGALSKSVRIYYNPITAKLEPIAFDAHKGAGTFKNFIILDMLHNKPECSYICGDKVWFDKFFFKKDGQLRNEFISEYLKYLRLITSETYIDKFLKNNKEIIDEMNSAFYSDFSKEDKIFWQGFVPYVYDKNFLKNRAKFIKTRIFDNSHNKFKFNLKNTSLQFDTTSSLIPVNIEYTCEQGNKVKNIWLWGKDKINWNPKCKEVSLLLPNGLKKNIYFYNNPQLTKSFLPIKTENLKSILNHKDIVHNNDKIFFEKKELILKENYIIPKNKIFIVNAGQKIIIKNNSTIFSKSNLFFNGSDEKPCHIIGSENSGNFIHFDGDVEINNCVVSNLVEPKNLRGFDLYGALNFINSKIKIKGLILNNMKSEDSINFINSDTEVDKLTVLNSRSDAIDVDGGKFIFNQIYCNNIGNDCIDTSNAKSYGEKIIAKNVMDKSISIGENSEFFSNNIDIYNSEIGIAVKDGSTMKTNNLKIENISLPIAVFKKKTEYVKEASLEISKIDSKKSNDVYLVDNNSNLVINGKKISGKLSGQIIEKMLYGNIYGRATYR
tara:strand:+ start:19309 stop:21930 length:2622 start_codon:yes stop_codon:yes gene_type:complete